MRLTASTAAVYTIHPYFYCRNDDVLFTFDALCSGARGESIRASSHVVNIADVTWEAFPALARVAICVVDDRSHFL